MPSSSELTESNGPGKAVPSLFRATAKTNGVCVVNRFRNVSSSASVGTGRERDFDRAARPPAQAQEGAGILAIELEHRFGKGSRVRDYWLAESEGFEVQSPDGRSVGTVRQVLRERDGKAVVLLVEARRVFRRTGELVLEADAVEEVAPWRSTLVVPAQEATVRKPRLAGRGRRLVTASVAAARGADARALAAAQAVWARWPAVRDAIGAGVSASWRAALSTTGGAAAALRARWPGARARIRAGWASIVAAVFALAGVLAEQLTRLLRALAARVAAARSQAR